MITLHLLIEGKVQGVFFRATAKEVAEEIGVTGWIKNTKEGNVEALVSGSEQEVERFIKWCDDGPKHAKVTNVIASPYAETHFDNFKITH